MNLLANAIDALEESNLGRSFKAIDVNPHCITVCTGLWTNGILKFKLLITVRG